MGNASDRTMPKKAYVKCVANEKVSHKKLVKKVTEHLEGIYEFLQRKKMENLNELERKN